MPSELTHRCVHIEEVSGSGHTITGVATAITALLGRGLAPLKPAEFVVIKLQQMAGRVDA